MNNFHAKLNPTQIAFLLAAVFAVTMSYLAIAQHYAFLSQQNDFTVMKKAIAHAAAGDLTMGGRLKIHHNFIFWFIAPIYKIFPFSETLFILTSVFCAMAGLGVYFVARALWGPSLVSLIPALIFWSSPVVQYANLFDFHIICLSTALVVWVYWAVFSGRKGLGVLLFVLLMLCQEDLPIVGFFMGIGFILIKERRIGVIFSVIAVLYFLTVTEFIVPEVVKTKSTSEVKIHSDPKSASSDSDHSTLPGNVILKNRYGWLGSSPADVIVGIFKDPIGILKMISDPMRWRPILYFVLAGGILCWAAWPILLPTIPFFGMGLLAADMWPSAVMGTYYWITVQALFTIAFIFSLKNEAFRHSRSGKTRIIIFSASAVLLTFFLSPLPYGYWAKFSDFKSASKQNRDVLVRISQLIPDNAVVATTMNLTPHLDERYKQISILNYQKAEFVMLRLDFKTPFNKCYNRRASYIHLLDLRVPDFANLARRIIENGKIVAFEENFILVDVSRSQAVNDPGLIAKVETTISVMEEGYRNDRDDFRQVFPVSLCQF